MSGIYIGPFGRILSAPETTLTSPANSTSPSSPDPLPRMLAQRPPVLPLPSRLEFGSDPMSGFSDPGRYGQRRSYAENMGGQQTEKLPSVQQLLTPGSQSSIGASFPYQFSPITSGGARPGIASPSIQPHPNVHDRRETHYAHEPYHPAQSQTHPHYPGLERSASFTSDPSRHYTTSAYGSRDERGPHPYGAIQGSPHQALPYQQSSQGPPRESWNPPQGSPNAMRRVSPTEGQRPQHVVKPTPKLLGEKDMPGEGLCYVYDDGSHVRKNIDGETVNAHWGVTKAGKPRKRLAIACTTCREKKIKCEPGDPKCDQCEKSGRECRYQTAARGETSSYDQQARTPSSMSGHTESLRGSGSPYQTAHSARPDFGRQRSASTRSLNIKRRHSSPNPSDPTGPDMKRNRRPPRSRPDEYEHSATSHPQMQSYIQSDKALEDEWHTNPFDTYGDVAQQLLSTYLQSVNLTFPMFPNHYFQRWCINTSRISPAELMVIYSILAVASYTASKSEDRRRARRLAEIASYAVFKCNGSETLHLAQARVLLALYYHAEGDVNSAADYLGSGAALALRLNNNTAQSNDRNGQHGVSVYNLSATASSECARRTLWIAFLLDALISSEQDVSDIFGTIIKGSNIPIEEISSSLPCQDEQFENGEQFGMPTFDKGIVDFSPVRDARLFPTGFQLTISITSTWHSICMFLRRNRSKERARYSTDWDAFRSKTTNRLDIWLTELPESMRLTSANATAFMSTQYMDQYFLMHTIYLSSLIALSRFMGYKTLVDATVGRNVRDAHQSALQLLHATRPLLDAFSIQPHSAIHMQNQNFPRLFSPFIASAIAMAADTLTTAGTLETPIVHDTLRLLRDNLAIIEYLALTWAGARRQASSLQERIDQITAALSLAETQGKTAWLVKSCSSFRGVEQGAAEPDVFSAMIRSSDESTYPLLKAMGLHAEPGKVFLLKLRTYSSPTRDT